MDLAVYSTPEDLAVAAAQLVADHIRVHPTGVLLAPTGRTPMLTYQRLAHLHEHGEVPTSELRVAQLDEYLGVGPDDPRSLYGWLRRALLEPLNISPQRVIRLHGDAMDTVADCREYDTALQAAGGIDLCLLGLGANGHLGFNEPPSGAGAPTRVVTLTPQTIAANASYWASSTPVPHRALTAGMTHLVAAGRTVLLVTGAAKQQALQQTLHGSVTPDFPASYLRTMQNVTIMADREALGGS